MPDISISGSNLIAGESSRRGSERFHSVSRADGESLAPEFVEATADEVADAAAAAWRAFLSYRSLSGVTRAGFLDEIARQIEMLGDALLERAHRESGLPIARLTGERARTCNQLRMFAALLREGSWVDVRIDPGDLSRAPLPKPDLRTMLVPLGPVAVFGASNFPLAFSVAGGDTASALAAGCTVVVKAHPAHPGTSEMVARAATAAAQQCGMPPGVLSMIHGGVNVGRMLVQRPEFYAVGFTGSKSAGRSLYDAAAARERPIPVYAEMGSVNPTFLMPGALAERSGEIAKGYAESLTAGVGQFCTNPGIVVGMAGETFDGFLSSVVEKLGEIHPGLMLTDDITRRYHDSTARWFADANLTPVYSGESPADRAAPALFRTSAATFVGHPELAEEVFGPAAIAVACASVEEMLAVARALEGQLTSSIHLAPSDRADVSELLPVLVHGAGRIVFNGFPTGVEVGHAMQHGGPYPATTDSRTTSVGTAAILRFVRPVAFQNAPPDLLPQALWDANPHQLWRRIDGKVSDAPL